jgi:type II secretory pathway pseudopilin PulG
MARDRARDERGETLVEILLAVVLLGITTFAIFDGISLVTSRSGLIKSQVNVSAVVQAAAATVVGDSYLTCTQITGGSSYALPAASGYSDVSPATIQSISYWNGSSFVATCSTGVGATALEKITVTATATTSSSSQSITLVKAVAQ